MHPKFGSVLYKRNMYDFWKQPVQSCLSLPSILLTYNNICGSSYRTALCFDEVEATFLSWFMDRLISSRLYQSSPPQMSRLSHLCPPCLISFPSSLHLFIITSGGPMSLVSAIYLLPSWISRISNSLWVTPPLCFFLVLIESCLYFGTHYAFHLII